MELFVNLTVAGIDAAIADHFVMLFRDMADQALDKFHGRDGFFHIFVILMAVVVEGNKITVVFVNAGGGNYRPAEITADILNDRPGVTGIGFGINIESVFVFPVTTGFDFFKGRPDDRLHFIEQGSTEGIA